MKKFLTKGQLSALIVIGVLVIDQIIKIWVKTNMYWHESIKITDWFYIYFTENNGMAFGMEFFDKFFLTGFRIIAAIAITWMLIQYSKKAFFVLYANIDGFDATKHSLEYDKLPVMDKWLLSKLNSLTETVDTYLSDYKITETSRVLDDFVDELSNWYVCFLDMICCMSVTIPRLLHVLNEHASTIPSMIRIRYTRSSFACRYKGISPISSRKITPLSANSNLPIRPLGSAPVNAPLT